MDFAKEVLSKYGKDKIPILAASLAYYTVFALAPILIVVISLLVFFGQGDAQNVILDQVRGLLGSNGAQLIETMIENRQAGGGNWIATVVGTALLVVGATGLFLQLQTALNLIWGVEPDPDSGGVGRLILNRILSLGMVLVIAFLLLVSLVLTAVLESLTQGASAALPGAAALWMVLNWVVSIAVIGLLFALIFRYLPDARVPWRQAMVGGFITSILFTIGKWALGLYLSTAAVASSYGAAGSLVVLLLWVFYSAQILLIGAEFTETYARRSGHAITPDDHAVRRESWS